jgi:AbiV family abortive infection protein
MDDIDKRLFAELVRGAELAFANAEQLFEEAELLRDRKHFARSVFLHQISMEECAKVDMIGAAATSLTLGHTVDMKRLVNGMRDHKRKNFANAYMSGVSEAEKAARENNDVKGSIEAFKKWQGEIHLFLNTAKNASMYVDFVDDEFVAPVERIDEQGAIAIAAVNRYFMTITGSRLRALKRAFENPSAAVAETRWFEERLVALKKEKPNLSVKELQDAIQAMVAEMAQKFRKG